MSGYDFAYAYWMRYQPFPDWNRLHIGSFIIFENMQKVKP